MDKIFRFGATLLVLIVAGCTAGQDKKSEGLFEIVVEGNLAKFQIPGVQRIGDWYRFTWHSLEVRVRINRADVSRHNGFTSSLYFNEVVVVYPRDWTIMGMRQEGDFLTIWGRDKKGGEVSNWVETSLLRPSFTGQDGRTWAIMVDRKYGLESISVTWRRKDEDEHIQKMFNGVTLFRTKHGVLVD